MIGKLGLLLFFLQLCHFAMLNKTIDQSMDQLVPFAANTKNDFSIRRGNKLYYAETKIKVNWHQAAHNCRKMGGNLLNIENCKEMDLIIGLFPLDRYWISANCLAKNMEFTSITTGEAMPYYRWDQEEPKNLGSGSCVEIKRFQLNVNKCSDQLYYICEAKIMY